MAWLAVDRDGVCNIYNCKPKRSCGQWVIPKDFLTVGQYITVSKETAFKLAEYKLTFNHEPIEI